MFQLSTVSPPRHAHVEFFDAHGNAAVVDGAPVWASTGGLLTVTPDADGMGVTIQPIGPLGPGQLNVSADADLGAGIVALVGIEDFVIVAGTAVVAVIRLDTPTP
jgi:hypothetical protein